MRIRWVAVSVALVAAACRGGERRVADDSSGAGRASDGPTAEGAATGQVFTGPGYTLRLPAGTRRTVSEDCKGGRLVGPPARAADGRQLPRFELCVETYANAARHPLAAWVDSVRSDRNRTLDRELAQLGPAEPVMVGRERMLRLQPFCGDCDAYEYYASAGDRVLAFSFETGIRLVGTRPEQEAAHLAVMRSLQWTAARGAP